MAEIRAIGPDELPAFVATATPAEHVEAVSLYVRDLLSKGAMRTDWCYLLLEEGRPVGRVAFWTLPGSPRPSDLVLLDLAWADEHARTYGTALLGYAARMARTLGTGELDHVLDMPAQWPQWQHHLERRVALLEDCGFILRRETYRFELDPRRSAPRTGKTASAALTFRPLRKVGKDSFLDAIRRVSSGTLDARIAAQQRAAGPFAQAQSLFATLAAMTHEPDWWELAYTHDGNLVGLIVPVEAPSAAMIGYIGVVPEHRGRGHVDTLLARGTATLARAGAALIRADADMANTPMIRAFGRVGYSRFARRREYGLPLQTLPAQPDIGGFDLSGARRLNLAPAERT